MRSVRLTLLVFAVLSLHPAVAQRQRKFAVQGDSLLASGRVQEALVAYERSFKARETSRGAYGIAECHSSLTSIADTTWYRTALNLAKHEYAKAEKAIDKRDALYRMAYCHQRLGEHQQALKWFGNMSCKDRHADVEIGRTYMAMGCYTEALVALERSAARFPDEASTLIEECKKALGR